MGIEMPHRNLLVMERTYRRLSARFSASLIVHVYPPPQPNAPELFASSTMACFAESESESHVWSAASISDDACSTALTAASITSLITDCRSLGRALTALFAA